MSKDLLPEDDRSLTFDEATNLTIEEAVQKEADLAFGITDEDGVLDKYIKKNREKVGEFKFGSQTKDLTQDLDTTSLDRFIRKQRQDLTNQDVVEPRRPQASPVPMIDFSRLDSDASSQSAEEERFYGDGFLADKPVYKHKKLIVGSLAALLLGTVGLAYGLNQFTKEETGTSASTSTTRSSKASSASMAQEAAKVGMDKQAFDQLYTSFFADEGLTKPLNSAFDQLPTLEAALKQLEGTSVYDDAKAKYDSLAKVITAIQTLNEKFESPAILDGERQVTAMKAGASLDDLTAAVLNTGRPQLDSLLQGVITEARGLAQAPAPISEVQEVTPTQESLPVVEDLPLAKEEQAVALQRQLSRVPYNDQVIADSQNPAWTFTPGVLEEIVRVSQERGYISGDAYFLEPVNIINGNSYYNMFKPDGTYLFSINAKTGYFVGNGAGYAEELDY